MKVQSASKILVLAFAGCLIAAINSAQASPVRSSRFDLQDLVGNAVGGATNMASDAVGNALNIVPFNMMQRGILSDLPIVGGITKNLPIVNSLRQSERAGIDELVSNAVGGSMNLASNAVGSALSVVPFNMMQRAGLLDNLPVVGGLVGGITKNLPVVGSLRQSGRAGIDELVGNAVGGSMNMANEAVNSALNVVPFNMMQRGILSDLPIVGGITKNLPIVNSLRQSERAGIDELVNNAVGGSMNLASDAVGSALSVVPFNLMQRGILSDLPVVGGITKNLPIVNQL